MKRGKKNIVVFLVVIISIFVILNFIIYSQDEDKKTGGILGTIQGIWGFVYGLFSEVLVLGENVYFVDMNSIGGQCSDSNPGTIDQPWCTVLKGFSSAQPGDTIYFRQGKYRQNITLLGSYFSHDATADNRIYFRGYPGEEAIITCLKLRNHPDNWTHEIGEIYSTPLTPQQLGPDNINIGRIPHVSQDGIPLRLMTERKVNGNANDLTGEGQWARSVDDWKLYVWAKGGGNPGDYKTEFCEFVKGGSNVIDIQGKRNRAEDDDEADYLTFENLIIEGGYYPISIETDYIHLINSTFRNSYGDGIKGGGARPDDFSNPDDPAQEDYYNVDHGLVENCDIYNFGESGIDITGGDYWIIKNNKIHDGRIVRNNLGSQGIMLKNNNRGSIVEKNQIYNILKGSAIAIGGQSFGGIAKEGVNLTVRNNIIYNIDGHSYAILFMSCINCSFYNNLLYNSSLTESLVYIRESDPSKPYYNENIKIKNNIFYNNDVNFLNQYSWNYYIFDNNYNGLEIDNNIINHSREVMMNHNDGTWDIISFAEFKAMGYEQNSIADIPIFVDEANLDFHLVEGSPGINQGICLNEVEDDFSGISRPQGDECDIGPYEYIPKPLTKAFPEAEGFGAYALGGRGDGIQTPQIIIVDTLDDVVDANDGKTSLREAAKASGPRFVVFSVGGVIELQSSLDIINPYITIAGQTAPSPGITLTGYHLSIQGGAHDVVVRYIRIRPIVVQEYTNSIDGISLGGNVEEDIVNNVIIDHCSIAWALDEAFSTWRWVGNFTLQNSFIIEGAEYGHEKGPHSAGILTGGNHSQGNTQGTFHHNLLAHNADRSPKLSGGKTFDFRNNIVYNWITFNSGNIVNNLQDPDSQEAMNVNFVNNFYMDGSDVTDDLNNRWIVRLPDTDYNPPQVYFQGNIGPFEAVADDWDAGIKHHGYPERYRLNTPFSTPEVETDSISNTLDKVLANSGANYPIRDLLDEKTVNEINYVLETYSDGNFNVDVPQYSADTDSNLGTLKPSYGEIIDVLWFKPYRYIEDIGNLIPRQYRMQEGQTLDEAKRALLDIIVAKGRITEQRKQEILADTSGLYEWERVNRTVPDINTVEEITPNIYGTAPVDTDKDGIPDDWEDSNNLDKNDAGDAILDLDGDGYLNIEEYLNTIDFCGNQICDAIETCSSCSQDCGACPTPSSPGNVGSPSGSSRRTSPLSFLDYFQDNEIIEIDDEGDLDENISEQETPLTADSESSSDKTLKIFRDYRIYVLLVTIVGVVVVIIIISKKIIFKKRINELKQENV
tara:strand:+ start:1489 stop:5334 length:3846 start_codon:yes stop_codon:yes gene_type:complete